MRQTSRLLLTDALSFLLIIALVAPFVFIPESALASNSDLAIKDAESAVASSKLSLEEAQTELNSIAQDCATLEQEVQNLQTQINETASKVLEAQQRMLDGREALGNAAKQEYKNNSSSTFIDILLGSSSFEELTQNAQYINQIMDYQSDEIVEQKQLKAELDEVVGTLNDQKGQQEAKLNALEDKRTEAQNVVNRASTELNSNTDKLESLKQQAAQLLAAQTQVQASQSAQPIQQTSQPEQKTQTSSSSNEATQSYTQPVTSEGWKTGLATAYGGSTDPSTPGTVTATGAPCNDSSMGVAIPMSWPNYRSYFGRTVEIVYNGQTVYATVNDCGGMGGGAVSLDLQPGVFKAFGFSSCRAWGKRTVQYRFL